MVLIPTASRSGAPRHRHAGRRPSTRPCSTCSAVVVAAARFRAGPGGRGRARWASPCSTSSSFLRTTPSRCADVRYVLTFGVMLAGGAGHGSTLTGTDPESGAKPRAERERRTAALYALSRELASARDRDEALAAAPAACRTPSRSTRRSFCRDRPDGSRRPAPTPYPLDERERGVAQWSPRPRPEAGQGTSTLPAAGRDVRAARRLGPGGRRARDPPGDAGISSAIPARRRLLEALVGPDGCRARAARADRAEPPAPRSRSRRSAAQRPAELALARLADARSRRSRGAASTLLQTSAQGARDGTRREARGHDRPGIAADEPAGRPTCST